MNYTQFKFLITYISLHSDNHSTNPSIYFESISLSYAFLMLLHYYIDVLYSEQLPLEDMSVPSVEVLKASVPCLLEM